MRVSILGMRLSVFSLAVVLFTMPFVAISCPGLTLSFTGLQLVGGTTVREPQMFGPPKEKAIEGEPVAALILVCAVAGLVGAFLPPGPGRVIGGLAGVLGAILLLSLKSKIEGDVAKQAMGLFEVRFGFGYWGVLMAMVGGILSNLLPTQEHPHARAEEPSTKSAAIELTLPPLSDG